MPQRTRQTNRIARGKWLLGIQPRHFIWIIKEHLAICERPGGYGQNHRKIRRQEEIRWIRSQGFTMVISVLSSPHNLTAYDEAGLSYMHVPLISGVDNYPLLQEFFNRLGPLLAKGERIMMHADEVSDLLIGVVGAFLRWGQFFNDTTTAITFTERLVGKALGSEARAIVLSAERLVPPEAPVRLPYRNYG